MALPLASHGHPGRLIAVCGMDGSGKSTMVSRLAEHLEAEGRSVVTTFQPSRYARESPLFQQYIYHPEERHLVDYRALICLLTSDRLQHIHETIVPALKEGTTVITDRYVFTAIAQMRARGYKEESWFFELLHHVPRPDLTVLCDPSFQVSQERVSSRDSWQDAYIEEHHDQVLYREFVRLADEEDIVRLDTSGEVDDALAALLALANPILQAR